MNRSRRASPRWTVDEEDIHRGTEDGRVPFPVLLARQRSAHFPVRDSSMGNADGISDLSLGQFLPLAELRKLTAYLFAHHRKCSRLVSESQARASQK